MDIVERLNTVREGMEAGLDDWPIASQIYEYKTAAEEITKLRETITAQAAVIERLTKWLHIERSYYLEAGSDIADDVCDYLYHPPTDSTQILDEVRKQERERCATVCEDQANEPECTERAMYCAEAIRAME